MELQIVQRGHQMKAVKIKGLDAIVKDFFNGKQLTLQAANLTDRETYIRFRKFFSDGHHEFDFTPIQSELGSKNSAGLVRFFLGVGLQYAIHEQYKRKKNFKKLNMHVSQSLVLSSSLAGYMQENRYSQDLQDLQDFKKKRKPVRGRAQVYRGAQRASSRQASGQASQTPRKKTARGSSSGRQGSLAQKSLSRRPESILRTAGRRKVSTAKKQVRLSPSCEKYLQEKSCSRLGHSNSRSKSQSRRRFGARSSRSGSCGRRLAFSSSKTERFRKRNSEWETANSADPVKYQFLVLYAGLGGCFFLLVVGWIVGVRRGQ